MFYWILSLWVWFLVGMSTCKGQFTVQPESVVQAEGLEAVFECLYPGATGYSWVVNGSLLPLPPPPGVHVLVPTQDSPTARLIIPATPQYNNTVVQCEATLREGGVLVPVLSENVTRKVQGPLPPIPTLHFNRDMSSNTTITISWSPPFSLDLTTAEPDIQYCVDVYDSTDRLVESVCNVTEERYSFSPSNPNPSCWYTFTVTPRSNVEGALNGTTSQPVEGSVLGEPVPVNSSEMNVNFNVTHIQVRFSAKLLGPPGRHPMNYYCEVNCNQPFSCNAPPNISSGTVEVALNSNCFKKHEKCVVTLTAENSAGSMQYTSMNTSTHDVQNASATYSIYPTKRMDISCFSVNEPADPGFLIIIATNNPLLTYRAVRRSDSGPITNVSIPGQFENATVFVYDLRNNLPEQNPAVHISSSFSRSSSTESKSFTPENNESSLGPVEVTSADGKICLGCSFSTDEVTGCVGVIHSAQLEDLALTTLTLHTVETYGNGVENCTKMNELTEGNYTVAVFGKSDGMLEQVPANVTNVIVQAINSPSESPPPMEVALPVMLVLSISIVAVLLVVIWRHRMKTRATACTEAKEESPPCYEDLQILSHEYENVALTAHNNISPDDTHIFIETHPVPQPVSTVDSFITQGPPSVVMGNSLQEVQLSTMPDSPLADTQTGTETLFADMDPKRPSSDQLPEDLERVQYASIDAEKLMLVNSSDDIREQVDSFLRLQPPPTAESVFSELHPIAGRWEEFGEALAVPEHILDHISTEGSDQVRLHEVVQYYFSTSHPHSWGEIVRALEEIGETEAADRIIRTGRGKRAWESHTVYCNDLEPSPSLPPRNCSSLVVSPENLHICSESNADADDEIRQWTKEQDIHVASPRSDKSHTSLNEEYFVHLNEHDEIGSFPLELKGSEAETDSESGAAECRDIVFCSSKNELVMMNGYTSEQHHSQQQYSAFSKPVTAPLNRSVVCIRERLFNPMKLVIPALNNFDCIEENNKQQNNEREDYIKNDLTEPKKMSKSFFPEQRIIGLALEGANNSCSEPIPRPAVPEAVVQTTEPVESSSESVTLLFTNIKVSKMTSTTHLPVQDFKHTTYLDSLPECDPSSTGIECGPFTGVSTSTTDPGSEEDIADECSLPTIMTKSNVGTRKVVMSHCRSYFGFPSLNPILPCSLLRFKTDEGFKALTVEDLQRRTRVTDAELDAEITEPDLADLADCFDDVNPYLYHLKLIASSQAHIEYLASRHNATVAMRQALKYWYQQKPPAATFRALLGIVLDLKKEDVATRVCQVIIKTTQPPSFNDKGDHSYDGGNSKPLQPAKDDHDFDGQRFLSNSQGFSLCVFFWLMEKFFPPDLHVPCAYKGVLVREQGYIFQPEVLAF